MSTDGDKLKEKFFTIGTVARLTGISCASLRVWEKRYEVKPASRSATGRREYSRRDLERLMLMKSLLDRGIKISDIARLDAGALSQLLDQLIDAPASKPGAAQSAPCADQIAELIRTLHSLEQRFQYRRGKTAGYYCNEARKLLEQALRHNSEAV